MSFVLDILRALGVGQSILLGGTLVVAAWYVRKGVGAAALVGGLFSSAAGYAFVILVAAGVSIALGWIDPSPSTATSQLTTAADAVWSAVGDWVVQRVQEVAP